MVLACARVALTVAPVAEGPTGVQDYFKRMPWLAVPREQAEVLRTLPTKFAVMGIPSLLMFSPEGEVLTHAGVSAVQSDPDGAHFPWKGHSAGIMSAIGPLIQIGLLIAIAYLVFSSFFGK